MSKADRPDPSEGAAVGSPAPARAMVHHTVQSRETGLRLDHLLAQLLAETSRSRITAAIKAADILVNGSPCKAGYRLKEGDLIEGELGGPPPLAISGEDIAFPVLFEDERLLVINKPPDLVVHPGSGNWQGTLVHGLVYHCRTIAAVGDEARPGIVHRLDKDTSGVMVVAKDDDCHRRLVTLFHDRLVEKQYLALVHGCPGRSQGRIVAPIGRHPVNRQKMAVREHDGRFAATTWWLEESFGGRYALLRLAIETGRTHQIRVHLAHLGYPVAGDTVYGPGRDNGPFPRQLLHSWQLRFRHPGSDEEMQFTAPLWPDFAAILDDLRNEQHGGTWISP